MVFFSEGEVLLLCLITWAIGAGAGLLIASALWRKK